MNNFVRVAVVGLGNMGSKHLRVLREIEGVEVCEVVEPDAHRFMASGFTSGYTNLGLMLSDYRRATLKPVPLDAVIIATPTATHYELAAQALKAGVSVFVEKPLAPKFWQAQELASLAAGRPNQVFMVGYIERFNPAVQALKKFIEAHNLRPQLIEARRSGLVNFDPPGPVIFELGSHDLDTIAYILDEEGPETVQGQGVDDHFAALLSYHDGLVASVLVDWLSPDKVRKMRVVCVEGTFYLDYIAQTLVWHPVGLEPESVAVERTEPLRVELEHFVACLDTGQEPFSNARTALAVARTLEAFR